MLGQLLQRPVADTKLRLQRGRDLRRAFAPSVRTQAARAELMAATAVGRWAVGAASASAPGWASDLLRAATAHKLLTLVMVDDGERVLLGRKKRGFGEGYYNGFGGKVEPGETVREAAERELQEEACIVAEDMKEAVFSATKFKGEPTETEEMAPIWFKYADVPYDKMWADDIHWYPMFLGKRYFRGVFAFSKSTLLWHTLLEGP